MNKADTLLVIPSYRDGTRLVEFLPLLCAALAENAGNVRVQVVADGSPANEQRWLAAQIEALRRDYALLLPMQGYVSNHGKGYAIRAGWATAPQAAWLAFVDADGATPATEVAALIAQAQAAQQPAVFMGVRTAATNKSVTRFWHRRIGSRVFNRWVRLCLGLKFADTQCGLKIIPRAFYASCVWHEAGFAFDLELLLRARAVGLPVTAQPISWCERPGSSLSPTAMLALFAAAYRLRQNLPQPPSGP
jgi:hypothetical protein